MMRRHLQSDAWLAVPGLSLWLLAIVLPLLGLFVVLFETTGGEQGVVETNDLGIVFVRSCVWAFGVGVISVLIGWYPGRVLAHHLMCGRRWLAIACVLPLLLPPYAVFWCWWQAWPPDGWFYEWAIGNDAVLLLRQVTLAVGLVCWSWPLGAWIVAARAMHEDGTRDDLLKMDGVRGLKRLRDYWQRDWPSLAFAALAIALVTFGNTTCFDLAQVFTFGNELRAIEASGGGIGQIVGASTWPSLMLLVGAVLLVVMFSRSQRPQMRRRGPARSRGVVGRLLTPVLIVISFVIPFGLAAAHLFSRYGMSGTLEQVSAFSTLYGNGFLTTLMVSVGAGVLLSFVALSQFVLRHQILNSVLLLGWAMGALLPATLIALGLERAYNSSFGIWIYQHVAIVLLADVARLGGVAALLGTIAARSIPGQISEQIQLDGVNALRTSVTVRRPWLLSALVSAFCVGSVLAMGEIAVTNFVRPAGVDLLAPSVLNAMHYQQPDTVMIALGLLALTAMIGAGVFVLFAVRSRRALGMYASMILVLLLFVPGCARDIEEAELLDTTMTFGMAGSSPGQFSYPRAIAIDPADGCVFIVDKTARIQRFNVDGEIEHVWQMPEFENGKPTGLAIGPDGLIYVADTHYHRVMVFDRDGNEQMQFGCYGEDPGEFIYPTDILFTPQGTLLVSEYGGNDRIQHFSADGVYIEHYGSFGDQVGQFNRPQRIVYSPDEMEIYVADACNHRICVLDAASGKCTRVIGSLGTNAGTLAYPYDLVFLEDGTMLVAEFGNNRVQHLTTDGRSLGLLGTVGFDVGQLQYPWGVDRYDDRVFVLDSGNHRVQVFDAP